VASGGKAARYGTSKRVRTPTVLQMEAVECGAAALAIVLAYYGRWVPLEELRVATGVSRDGAKAGNVVKAARMHGLDAKGSKAEVDDALVSKTPFIVFWNFNHFLVVEGANGTHVWVNDPAIGPRRITRQEFSDGFTGIMLEMEPGPDFQKCGERQSLFRSLALRLHGSRGVMAFVVLVTLMMVVPGLLMPAFLKNFIDNVLTRGDNDWLLPILVGLALTALFSSVLTYIQQRYLLRVQIKLAISSAGQFFWHVLRVPVVFYTQRYVGDVASRVQSCHRIAALLSGPLSSTLANSLMIIFYLTVMAIYSVPLTLIAVGLSGFDLLSVRIVQRRIKDTNSHLLNQQAKTVGASMAGLQAIETLKATGTEGDFFNIWSGYQTNGINAQQKLGVTMEKLSSVPGALNHLNTGLILGVGGLLIIGGELTIGGLVAFQSLMVHFTGPIHQLVGFGSRLQEIGGDLNRLSDVQRYELDSVFQDEEDGCDAHAEEAEPDGGERQQAIAKLSGALQLRNVSFGYNPLDPPLIENFNLDVSPGQRVALVGGSGSGKSTLSRLILGLYQPAEGEILYDGLPIKEVPRAIFTSSVGAVDQEIFLFEGTIRDNLTMWDRTIPNEVIVRAAMDADVHHIVASRAGGYEGRVAEGNANFSGGQSQRLEIARALAQEPSLLVLDEATSALDPLTEKKIDDNLRRRGCTCIIVAHRLSTIRDCDEIIVLDRGKIIERGNHDQLMADKGRYSELVTMQ